MQIYLLLDSVRIRLHSLESMVGFHREYRIAGLMPCMLHFVQEGVNRSLIITPCNERGNALSPLEFASYPDTASLDLVKAYSS